MAAILLALAGALLVGLRGSLPVELLRSATRARSDDLYPLLGAGYALKR